MNSVFHLKGLNGIRAIAAFSVVAAHIIHGLEFFGLPKREGLEMAGYGVTMFFTLSGYLITYLLIIEKEKFKDISIRKFYVRRILRIWPLYFFYLIVSLVLLYFLSGYEITGNVLFYFFLLANVPYILGFQFPVIGHFWLLGVEEQFYLFWPWVVLKVKNTLKWVVVFVIILMGLKVLSWIYFSKTGNNVPLFAIHITRFHCMGIGAIGAFLVFEKNEYFIKVVTHLSTQIILIVALLFCAVDKFHISYIIDDEIISLLSVVLIVNVSLNPKSLLKLDNKVLDYLGKISFGIYVYHPLVIFLLSYLIKDYIHGMSYAYQYVIISVLVVFFTIIVAAISYNYFEKPFLQLKDKFARISSSG